MSSASPGREPALAPLQARPRHEVLDLRQRQMAPLTGSWACGGDRAEHGAEGPARAHRVLDPHPAIAAHSQPAAAQAQSRTDTQPEPSPLGETQRHGRVAAGRHGALHTAQVSGLARLIPCSPCTTSRPVCLHHRLTHANLGRPSKGQRHCRLTWGHGQEPPPRGPRLPVPTRPQGPPSAGPGAPLKSTGPIAPMGPDGGPPAL